MQNGDVLDNNSVDNKNKGKAIQVGSLSDDEQLEVKCFDFSMLFISVITPFSAKNDIIFVIRNLLVRVMTQLTTMSPILDPLHYQIVY